MPTKHSPILQIVHQNRMNYPNGNFFRSRFKFNRPIIAAEYEMSYGRIPDEEDDQLHSAENEAPITGSNPAASAYVDSGFGGCLDLDANVLVSSNK